MTVQEDREQLFLELINRSRLDPLAEGALQGVADLSAGTGMTITGAAMQVLAYNAQLYQSATAHNQDMINNNFFGHTGSSGSSAGQRMAAANYGTMYSNGSTNFGWGENLAYAGTSGNLDATAEVYNEHRSLFRSNGHRANILNPNYEELGVSALTDSSYMGFNSLVTTHNFGYRPAAGLFVTGVNYTDSDNNNFYSIGESAAGRSAVLFQSGASLGATTTANAGGYQIQTTAAGPVELVFSGGGLNNEKGVAFTLAGSNIKADLTDSTTIETNVSATLTRGSQNLTLLSIDNVNGTGNELDNTINGNKGNNSLDGAAGHDTLIGNAGNDILIGGNGNDTLVGGLGNDTAVFAGNLQDYTTTYYAQSGLITLSSLAEGVDTASGLEFFQFADGTRTAAQIISGSGTVSPPAASIATTTASAAEGNTGTSSFVFTVSLDKAAAGGESVKYTVAGTGATAANSTDFSGALTGTLTFAAGQTQKIVTVQVTGDATVEQNETFAVTLSAASGMSLSTASATATIVNDDIAVNNINGTRRANVLNGTSGNDKINGLAGNDTINGNGGDDLIDGGTGNDIMDGGTGTDTAVFAGTFSSYNVSHNAGTGKFTLTNSSTGTDTAANIESFKFTDVIMTSQQLLESITPVAIPAANISADVLSAAEGNVGTSNFTFTVNLSQASGSSQSVNYVVAGTGANPTNANDFAGTLSGTIVFAAGSTSQTITIAVAGDNLAESNESFAVTLSSPSAGLQLGTATATSTITNDDGAVVTNPIVTISAAGSSVNEGNSGTQPVTFTVSLDKAAATDQSVSYSVAGSGASPTAANDFSGALAGTISFAAGEVSKTITVLVVGDTIVENNETFTVTLANATSGLNLGTSAKSVVIINDDTPAGAINGTTGNDTLSGTTGADTINGLAGDDSLNGKAGNDILNGGTGNDLLSGLAGADTFRFADLGSGTDTINEFSRAEDLIEFTSIYGIDFSDLVFSGQGTAQVVITGFDQSSSIVVKSATPLVLDATDFIFS